MISDARKVGLDGEIWLRMAATRPKSSQTAHCKSYDDDDDNDIARR